MNNYKITTYFSRSRSRVGVGIGTLIWIALIILKATGCIAMGWFWVLTFIIWVPLGILFLVVFIIVIVLIIVLIIGLIIAISKS